MNIKRDDIRNIAIIAHVDHGKTTLVDELLKQSGVFRSNQEVAERVMDSGDIERERGITILSKNTAITYKDTKINIIDTPGHADFGGEVERVLKMVNGVVLVVDAFEGAMPQTKFVLKKALELNLPVIVCINKIDRPEARPAEVVDEVLELFIDLDASEEQLDCPFIFASAKAGVASYSMDEEGKDMVPLFETILDYIPAPEGDPDAGTQVLISTIDYNEYVGRIGIGKVDNGKVSVNQDVVIVNHHDKDKMQRVKVSKLYEFDGLNKVEVKEAGIGSIVAISGIADIHIGDTLCSPENPVAIPFQKISEPTIAMHFIVNDSPLAGQEGKFVTSRHLRDRLFSELNHDVSLRVEETENTDSFKVSGRGELHLSVLIENMRREGYEFAVSKAEVLYKTDERGKKLEPMERAYIDVPDDFSGMTSDSRKLEQDILISDYLPENITVLDESATVSIKIIIEQLYKKKIQIAANDIAYSGLDDDYEVIPASDLSNVYVVVTGIASDLRNLNTKTISPYINCKGLGEGTYAMRLRCDVGEECEVLEYPKIKITIRKKESDKAESTPKPVATKKPTDSEDIIHTPEPTPNDEAGDDTNKDGEDSKDNNE
jgi:GTP-binding protein TypA/BipA